MSASALYLIYGSDDYLIEQKAREIVVAHVPPAARELGLEIIDGRAGTQDEARGAIARALEAVRTDGFFGGGKLVWLKDAAFLNPLVAPGDAESVKARLAELTACVKAGLPSGQRLLITATTIARNTSFFKACQAAGEVFEFGGNEKPWELEKLARARLDGLLERRGLRMSAAVRERFLARTGPATRLIVQELEKLALYLGNTPAEVSDADVDAVVAVSREAEAWDLTDALGRRDAAGVVRALLRLQSQNEEPIKLAAMIETRLRDLLVLRQALDEGWLTVRMGGYNPTCVWSEPLPPTADALLRALPKDPRSAAPFIQGKNAVQAAAYTLAELRRARHLINAMRERLVSSATPPDLLLEMTLLKIVGGRKAAPRPQAAA
jgi:DNA polymerase-3 subunit delta